MTWSEGGKGAYEHRFHAALAVWGGLLRKVWIGQMADLSITVLHCVKLWALWVQTA